MPEVVQSGGDFERAAVPDRKRALSVGADVRHNMARCITRLREDCRSCSASRDVERTLAAIRGTERETGIAFIAEDRETASLTERDIRQTGVADRGACARPIGAFIANDQGRALSAHEDAGAAAGMRARNQCGRRKAAGEVEIGYFH